MEVFLRMAELFNKEKVNECLQMFEDSAKELIAETCDDIDLEKFMKDGDGDAVRKSITKIQNNLVASIPQGIPVPGVSLYVTPLGGEYIDVISISVTNKFKAVKTFKFKGTITSRNSSLEGAVSIMMEIYKKLIVDAMAEHNLGIMNRILERATGEAGLPYNVTIVTPLGVKDRKVDVLTNEEVVFVADMDRVFDMGDLLILAEPVENLISEEAIEDAFNSLVAELAACQMPQQLVASHGGVTIRYICNINKQVRPMTLIKKVCTKATDKIIGNKDTLAYWTDGESYALVVRREGGHFDVVLDPFNVETMLRSDVNVLAKLGQESDIEIGEIEESVKPAEEPVAETATTENAEQ